MTMAAAGRNPGSALSRTPSTSDFVIVDIPNDDESTSPTSSGIATAEGRAFAAGTNTSENSTLSNSSFSKLSFEGVRHSQVKGPQATWKALINGLKTWWNEVRLDPSKDRYTRTKKRKTEENIHTEIKNYTDNVAKENTANSPEFQQYKSQYLRDIAGLVSDTARLDIGDNDTKYDLYFRSLVGFDDFLLLENTRYNLSSSTQGKKGVLKHAHSHMLDLLGKVKDKSEFSRIVQHLNQAIAALPDGEFKPLMQKAMQGFTPDIFPDTSLDLSFLANTYNHSTKSDESKFILLNYLLVGTKQFDILKSNLPFLRTTLFDNTSNSEAKEQESSGNSNNIDVTTNSRRGVLKARKREETLNELTHFLSKNTTNFGKIDKLALEASNQTLSEDEKRGKLEQSESHFLDLKSYIVEILKNNPEASKLIETLPEGKTRTELLKLLQPNPQNERVRGISLSTNTALSTEPPRAQSPQPEMTNDDILEAARDVIAEMKNLLNSKDLTRVVNIIKSRIPNISNLQIKTLLIEEGCQENLVEKAFRAIPSGNPKVAAASSSRHTSPAIAPARR